MNSEQLESVLYLLDERPFHRCRPSRLAWGAAGLLGGVIAVYLWAAWTGDLFWQDRPMLDGVTSVFSLGHLWTRTTGVFQPLSLTLLWLERRVFGRSPTPYHCLAAVLHALGAILLWLILRRLGVRGAWLGAALFAVHPVQVQSVAWIRQQPHVVCGVFVLLAVWVYLRWARVRPPLPAELATLEPEEPPGPSGYVTALVVGALAMLSGPAGLALPLVLMLLVWWKQGSLARRDWIRLAPFFALAVAVGVAGAVLYHRPADPFAIIAPSPTTAQRFAIAARAVAVYAIDVLWAYPAQFIHPRWDLAWDAWNALPVVLIPVLAIVAWSGRRRWGLAPAAGLFLFLALLLPGILVAVGQLAPSVYVADRAAYLAMAVPLSAIAAGLFVLASRLADSTSMHSRTARAVVAAAAIIPAAAFAVLQSLAYHDADAGFKFALAHDPANVTARAAYALYLTDEDPTKALTVLDDTPAASASDVTVLAARARVASSLGRHDDAVGGYLLVQRLAPDHPDVRLGLAAAYDAAGLQAMTDGRRDDAFEAYQGALDAYDAARGLLSIDHDAIHDGVGRVFLHEGRFDDALEQFDEALRLNPADAAAHAHKAQAFYAQALAVAGARGGGKLDLSEQALRDAFFSKFNLGEAEIGNALKINPSEIEAYTAAADMRRRLGQPGIAEQEYRVAIQSAPRSFRLWTDLGAVQAAQGRAEEAARSYERATTLNPDSAEAWTGLGFAQSTQRQFAQAVRSFDRALALQADAADALRGKRLAQAQLPAGKPKT